MLQKFFAGFIILIIFMIVLIIIKIALPMWRFMVRADAVIILYACYNNMSSTIHLLEEIKSKFNVSNETLHVLSYGKYKLKFANNNEASIEFEKLVNEALEYYDKLGWIAEVDNTFKTQKDELIRICSEVRTMRWQNQEI